MAGVGVLLVVVVARSEGAKARIAGVLEAASERLLEGAQEPEAAPIPPVNVDVEVVVAQGEVRDVLELPAVVEPNCIVQVSSEVPGRVERIAFEEGAAVKRGEPIVYLNTDLLQAGRDRAAADAAYAREQYERLRALTERGAVTPEQRDRAAATMAMAAADLALAEARLERATILCPLDGVLDKLWVEEGEYVQDAVALAELVDVDTVKVVVQVPERDVGFFRTGAGATAGGTHVPLAPGLVTAEVEAFADGHRKVFGTITYISELADEQTHSTRMEITVAKDPRALRSGQIVKARLTRRVLKGVIMIPLAAVIPLESGHAVYVVNGEEAQRRSVEIGLIQGLRVEVTTGLSEGDRLIVAGHRFVGPGQRVNVVADEEGKAAGGRPAAGWGAQE
jgi:membrane fusion protein (multidrug efflux system)